MNIQEKIARKICEVWGYEWCPHCDIENSNRCDDYDDQMVHAHHSGIYPDKALYREAATVVIKLLIKNDLVKAEAV